MLYILLIAAILITLRLAFLVAVSRRKDAILKELYTIYCEDAVVTRIDKEYNEFTGHDEVALFLNYSIHEGEEVKNGKVRWFISETQGTGGHAVGDIFPIMISPKENRAISLEVWDRMLRDASHYVTGLMFGIGAIVLIVSLIVRGGAA